MWKAIILPVTWPGNLSVLEPSLPSPPHSQPTHIPRSQTGNLGGGVGGLYLAHWYILFGPWSFIYFIYYRVAANIENMVISYIKLENLATLGLMLTCNRQLVLSCSCLLCKGPAVCFATIPTTPCRLTSGQTLSRPAASSFQTSAFAAAAHFHIPLVPKLVSFFFSKPLFAVILPAPPPQLPLLFLWAGGFQEWLKTCFSKAFSDYKRSYTALQLLCRSNHQRSPS